MPGLGITATMVAASMVQAMGTVTMAIRDTVTGQDMALDQVMVIMAHRCRVALPEAVMLWADSTVAADSTEDIAKQFAGCRNLILRHPAPKFF